MIVICLSPIMKTLQKTNDFIPQDEDIYLGVKQLSQYTMGTYYVNHGESYTYLDYDNNEVTIVLDNHRLVKKPGFEILLFDIDDLSFEIKEKWIYMNLTRKQRKYSFLIAYQKEKEIPDDEEVIE